MERIPCDGSMELPKKLRQGSPDNCKFFSLFLNNYVPFFWIIINDKN